MKNLTIFLLVLVYSCNSPNNTPDDPPENPKFNQFWMLEHGTFGRADLELRQDTIYATGYPYLYAVSTKNGQIYWNSIVDSEQRMLGHKILVKKGQVVINQLEVLKAYDQANGEDLWKIDGKEDIEFRENGEHSITPTGYIFSTYNKSIAAVSFSGKVEFVRQVDSLFDIHGALYDKGNVYINGKYTVHGLLTQGMLLAQDFATGQELWCYQTDNNGFYEQPVLEGDILYATTTGNSDKKEVLALDKNDGSLIWKTIMSYIGGKILLTDHSVIISTGYSLHAFSKKEGEEQWGFEWESGAPLFQPVYLEGYVYMSDHYRIFVLDAETGELVHEEWVPSGGSYFWHLAVSEYKLFAQTSYQLIAYEPWHLRD